MGRLSLALRLALIVAGAMLTVQLLALAVQFTREDGFAFAGVRPSFAREMAGLARIFDRLPPLRRQIALQLVNAGRYTASLEPLPPPAEPAGPLLQLTARSIEQRIAEEGIAPDRITVSYVANDQTETPRGPLARLVGRHLRIALALENGGFLVVDPNSEIDAFVFGNMLAVVAGLIGLGVLGFAVLAVVRETRPLAALADNMEAFARTAVPRSLFESGAPELRSLIRATNAMQHQVAALIRNRALVLAGMSHDLRTQVTRLRLRLELLADSATRDRAIADVETMQALIEETLQFAAASDGGAGGRTDLVACVERLAGERAEAAPGSVVWSGAAGPVEVAIGETALRRVLDNLVDNAVAYGRLAELSLSVSRATASLAVADRGPGIPEGERDAIFEPFHRLEVSRSRSYGGTGLGLAVVRQIVDRHGGTVTVADRPGGGAVFTLSLPLAGRDTA